MKDYNIPINLTLEESKFILDLLINERAKGHRENSHYMIENHRIGLMTDLIKYLQSGIADRIELGMRL